MQTITPERENSAYGPDMLLFTITVRKKKKVFKKMTNFTVYKTYIPMLQ